VTNKIIFDATKMIFDGFKNIFSTGKIILDGCQNIFIAAKNISGIRKMLFLATKMMAQAQPEQRIVPAVLFSLRHEICSTKRNG
jgi:hypothetical protein